MKRIISEIRIRNDITEEAQFKQCIEERLEKFTKKGIPVNVRSML